MPLLLTKSYLVLGGSSLFHIVTTEHVFIIEIHVCRLRPINGCCSTLLQFSFQLFPLISLDADMIHQQFIISVLCRDLLLFLREGFSDTNTLANLINHRVRLFHPVDSEHLIKYIVQSLATCATLLT